MLTQGPVVVRSKEAPKSRADTQYGKEFARYKLPRNRLDNTAPDPCMESRWFGKRDYVRGALRGNLEALEHGKGHSLCVCIGPSVLEQIKLLRIVDRQQAQQHCVK